ncbi:hypothetical protein AAMO2058_000910600 [Amorphochlora amoebiformis]
MSSSHKKEKAADPKKGKYQKWKPRTVDVYRREKNTQIGEGTYGSVFAARAPDGRKVALKKIRKDNGNEGFPITAIREIKFLKNLKHDNVVELLDVVSSPGPERSVYMVFEYCDHDLTGLLDTDPPIAFTKEQIKYYMKCLFEALYYLHKKVKILHRDVKGANILISNNGDVKLADFGLARAHNEQGKYTNRVVTLWYRPPELLLGSYMYDQKIDMWSAGCLFAEMLRNGKPLFRGSSELNHLEEIYKVCGTPDMNGWEEAKTLPWYKKHEPLPRRLKDEFHGVDPVAVDLLDQLLTMDPKKRIDSDKALDHNYFFVPPEIMKKEEHPRYTKNHHEYESKKRRAQRRAQTKARGNAYPSKRPRDANWHSQSRGQGGAPGGGRGGRGSVYPSSNRRSYPPPNSYRHGGSNRYPGSYGQAFRRGGSRGRGPGTRGPGQGRGGQGRIGQGRGGQGRGGQGRGGQGRGGQGRGGQGRGGRGGAQSGQQGGRGGSWGQHYNKGYAREHRHRDRDRDRDRRGYDYN